MTGRYLTEMADVLRAAGLDVTEQVGWQTRARSSGGYATGRPSCIMWHHAASAIGATTKAIADYGSFTHIYRPVQNLALGRAGDIIVCAAGATNTNGAGGPVTMSKGVVPLDSMNLYAIAIEAANNGVGEPWPEVMIDAYFTLTIALTKAYEMQPDDLGTHTWWAPTRKVDPARADAVLGPYRPKSINVSGSWDVLDLKAEARKRATPEPGPVPDPIPGGEMKWSRLRIKEAGAIFMGWSDGLNMPQVEWVNGADPAQLLRYQNYERKGFAHDLSLSYIDLTGVTLLGLVPSGDAKFTAAGHTWTRSKFGNVIGG